MNEYVLIVYFDFLTFLFLTLYLLKISRRGVDTTVRGELLVGDRLSVIEDGISRDRGTLNLASGSESTFRESTVSLIGRIRSKRKTRSSSINYY